MFKLFKKLLLSIVSRVGYIKIYDRYEANEMINMLTVNAFICENIAAIF